MRITKRIATVTVTIGAAVGLMLGSAAPALADTQQAYVAGSLTGDGTGACEVFLLSAQVSAGGPAYVSAVVANSGTKTCTGWIERSTNKGKTWTTVSPRVAVPHSTPPAYAKTADYYDGPGDLARACYQYGTGKASCGSAVTLKSSTAKDAGSSLPLSYERTSVNASTSNNGCFGGLASTTTAKKSTSSVDALIYNVSTSLNKAGTTCTGVLQESTNGGKSWKTVSASHAVPSPANTIAYGFTSTYADGTGHLARVCITLASKQHCSKGW